MMRERRSVCEVGESREGCAYECIEWIFHFLCGVGVDPMCSGDDHRECMFKIRQRGCYER